MQQTPSLEANSSSASPEVHCILQNPSVHYRIHNSQQLIHVLIQINTVHTQHTPSSGPF
jgi:hypothetical protein